MLKRFALIVTLLLATAGSAQAWSWHFNWGGSDTVKGSGEISSEARELGQFDGIALSGDFKVQVRQAEVSKITLQADKNLLPLIETRIVEGNKGRMLEIAAKRGSNLSGTVTPVIKLEMPRLRVVSINGSGDMRVEAMKTPELEANIAGSGKLEFVNLSSDSVSLKIAGSGDILASGQAGTLSISVAGSGDVKAHGLEAKDVKISIAGSGNAEVSASRTLKVSIAGSGDVSYAGSPEASISVAGSGKVRAKP
jgi:carbon monoxide dehydrogenase subunit G